ncbi:hypothetical protein IE81DRAFT_320383 [Ceraceosorus guamensis]|uniref:HAD-like protein n=1 Tax=Ceraceosorus guamensis TaxID=1522189 RepID=A0A316W6E9_9BASI|nr:hypothetical protein IE81DRAFT_320383 [Ceraceosorus guamensis]PWN45204.1 hypothetical protein IE81DRAFT_320383 [Ceraceosorus guamensis]
MAASASASAAIIFNVLLRSLRTQRIANSAYKAVAKQAQDRCRISRAVGDDDTVMLLLLDWDETLTCHDTLSLIAPPEGSQPHGAAFSTYSSAYSADLAAYKSQHAEPCTLDEQLKWLDGLDEVELKSQERIEQGGLFRGALESDLLQRATRVQLRRGVDKLAQWAQSDGHESEVHIISVGWSARFIEGSLKHHLSWVPNSIHANEVELNSQGIGTGRLTKSASVTSSSGGIRTSTHKAAEAASIDLQARKERALKGLTVYAGDSGTDLNALLSADLGIVMGEAKGLKEILNRIEQPDWLIEMNAWLEERRSGRRRARDHTLVRVDDWLEAVQVLQELHQ